ncbi:hypothetical protein BG621_01955 [Parasaccharibacter apium]|nr:hypothetical protein BG621_01955 [Parasaccharibacter apium]
MKTLLNAFIALWRQAPLWRCCFILGVGGILMAAFFPSPWVKKHAPWLPGHLPPHTSNALQAANSAHDDSTEAESQSTNHPPIHMQYPSMAEIVRDRVTLAGHTIPLPKGEWHPILSAQISNDSPFSFLALVRTQQGAITGLIIAQATQQPIPIDQTFAATNVCHDDRNYLNHSLPLLPAGEDCIGAGTVVLQGDDVSTNPLINQSINRLQALGVTPIPPLFLAVQWRHIAVTSNGQAQIALIDTLIPPLTRKRISSSPPCQHGHTTHKHNQLLCGISSPKCVIGPSTGKRAYA